MDHLSNERIQDNSRNVFDWENPGFIENFLTAVEVLPHPCSKGAESEEEQVQHASHEGNGKSMEMARHPKIVMLQLEDVPYRSPRCYTNRK